MRPAFLVVGAVLCLAACTPLAAAEVSQDQAVAVAADFMQKVGWPYASLEHEVQPRDERGVPVWIVWYYRPKALYTAESVALRRMAWVEVNRETGEVYLAMLANPQVEPGSRPLSEAELAAAAERYARPYLRPGQVGERKSHGFDGTQHSFGWRRVHRGIPFIGNGVAVDLLPDGRLRYFAQGFDETLPADIDAPRLPQAEAVAFAHRLAAKAGVPEAALKAPTRAELMIWPPPRHERKQPSRLIWLVHVAEGTGSGAEVHLDGHTGELLHYYAAMGDLTAKLKPAQPTKQPAVRPKPATGKLKAAETNPAAKAAAIPISPVLIGAGAVVVAASVGAWLAGRRRRT